MIFDVMNIILKSGTWARINMMTNKFDGDQLIQYMTLIFSVIQCLDGLHIIQYDLYNKFTQQNLLSIFG